MEYEFTDPELEGLATDPSFRSRWPDAVARAFRKRVQQIGAAVDERDLRALKSLHFKRLKGDRSDEHSIRLNNQWRLIVVVVSKGQDKVLQIVKVEDYH